MFFHQLFLVFSVCIRCSFINLYLHVNQKSDDDDDDDDSYVDCQFVFMLICQANGWSIVTSIFDANFS